MFDRDLVRTIKVGGFFNELKRQKEASDLRLAALHRVSERATTSAGGKAIATDRDSSSPKSMSNPGGAMAKRSTPSRPSANKKEWSKQSYRAHRRKNQQFQSKVEASARCFSDCLLEILRQLSEAYRRGKPVTLIISEAPRLLRDGLKSCIRELFSRFLGIGEQFPDEIGLNPIKWAGKTAAKVIKEAVRGKPSSGFRQQLLSLLGREVDEAILLQPVNGHETSGAVQRTGGAEFTPPAQRKHEEAFLGPEATNDVRPSHKGNKGNPALIDGKDRVTFSTAQQYLGITERQRQNLVRQGSLSVEGQGQNRRITTESLRKYLPPENPN